MYKHILLIAYTLFLLSCHTDRSSISFKAQAILKEKEDRCYIFYRLVDFEDEEFIMRYVDEDGYLKISTRINCSTSVYNLYQITLNNKFRVRDRSDVTHLRQAFNYNISAVSDSGFLKK